MVKYKISIIQAKARSRISKKEEHMKEKEKLIKETYEIPDLEVIEFELEDSIAASGNFGPDTICGGELF